MYKRAISAVLWFFTAAWGWNYVAMVSGLPAIVGLALGAAIAAAVWADPLHLLWPRGREALTGEAAEASTAPGVRGTVTDILPSP